MRKFEVGKTYTTRSACDWDCIFSYRIVGRTAKTVTVERANGDLVRRSVSPSWDNAAEICFPTGKYSMAPIITA